MGKTTIFLKKISYQGRKIGVFKEKGKKNDGL